MPEAAAERVLSPEFQRASNGLMLHIANGDFETSHAVQLNKAPSGIAKRSFDTLDAQHRKTQESQQELYDAAHRKILEGLDWPKEKITPQQLRHMHMIQWAKTETQRIRKMLAKNKDNPAAMDVQIAALNSLHLKIDRENVDVPSFIDQFYKTTSNITGVAGEFYKTFCTGDTNMKLLNALKEEQIIAIKDFLIDVLGSTDAYDALLATKQTQDALTAKTDFSQITPTIQANEQRILTYFKQGEQLLGSAHTTTPQPVEQFKAELVQKQESATDHLRHDLLHNEAAKNPEEHIKLMGEMTRILQEEKHEGRGKLKSTIQETVQSPEGQKVIHDGYVVYVPSKPDERIITIGDIHGDLETIEQILTKEGFFEDMESSDPKLRLVFLGDLVDRGPKSVEVMTAVMQLKVRYKDRVHMIAADHDTISPAVSSHDFPTKLQTSFGSRASEIYQQYSEVFSNMPKMVVTGNGVVMVHGGPVAKPLSLAQIGRLEDTDTDGVAGEQFSWSDPLSVEISSSTDTKNAYLQQWKGAVKHAENEGITDDNQEIELYVNGPKRTLGEVKKAIVLIQEMPQGFKPNPDRITGSNYPILDTLLMGLLEYDQHGFEDFLRRIGATVMLRGHQTSNDVDGGQPNLYGDRLWTIHSTGTGSKESAYTGREAKPKYGIIAIDQPIGILSTQQIKTVW